PGLHPPLLAVGPSKIARPLSRPEALASVGLIHHANHWRFAIQEADERAPDRHADDEGAGAVDRIDDPAKPGIRVAMAVLLAFEPMVGEAIGKQFAYCALRRTVCSGDRIEPASARLVLDLDAPAEVRENGSSRSIGELVRRGNKGLEPSPIAHRPRSPLSFARLLA